MAAHDAGHGRKAQSAPGEFRRKERIEDPGPGGFVHAAAGVAHFQADVFPRAQRGRFGVESEYRRPHPRAGPHRNQALVAADRFGRIEHQIHEHLLQLAAIGFDRRQIGARSKLSAIVLEMDGWTRLVISGMRVERSSGSTTNFPLPNRRASAWSDGPPARRS